MSSESETSDLLNSLSQRINAIHQRILDPAQSIKPDLFGEVKNLRDRTETLETNEVIAEFLQKSKTLLESAEGYDLGNFKTKESLILSSEDMIKEQITQFEELKNLEQYINSESFQAVPQLSKSIAELKPLHLDQLQDASVIDTRLQDLIFRYNEIALLMSEKFTYWDAQLTKWENQTGQTTPV
eukprot:TRINITY_DN8288_c0_g1_i3.p1 TRINITY_DN8288_c0_g1~~TRINITY_DN8288_c0_g1_i3.p1  ORF type:complete len:184 (-),score=37.88 TRINITY_DN8288_c0_g1_i3:520-1071(-)